MGVRRLWELLEAFAAPTTPDAWRGMRIAIDASIWIEQFRRAAPVTATTSDECQLVLEGFLRRLLRLLYHGAVPVLVFDGAAPALKRAEQHRRAAMRDERQGAATTRQLERLVAQRLQEHAGVTAAEAAELVAAAARKRAAEDARRGRGDRERFASAAEVAEASRRGRMHRAAAAEDDEKAAPHDTPPRFARRTVAARMSGGGADDSGPASAQATPSAPRPGNKLPPSPPPPSARRMSREDFFSSSDRRSDASADDLARFSSRKSSVLLRQLSRLKEADDAASSVAAGNELRSASSFLGSADVLATDAARLLSGDVQPPPSASRSPPQSFAVPAPVKAVARGYVDDAVHGSTTLDSGDPAGWEEAEARALAILGAVKRTGTSSIVWGATYVVADDTSDGDSTLGSTSSGSSTRASTSLGSSSVEEVEIASSAPSAIAVPDTSSDDGGTDDALLASSSSSSSEETRLSGSQSDEDAAWTTVLTPATPTTPVGPRVTKSHRTESVAAAHGTPPPAAAAGQPAAEVPRETTLVTLAAEVATAVSRMPKEPRLVPTAGGGARSFGGNVPVHLTEVVDLLDALGVPFVMSPAEADATCGFLSARGLVDAVMSEDSDVMLFGARTVLRGFFARPTKKDSAGSTAAESYGVMRVDAASLEAVGISREKLIGLALLMGSDYTGGVAGFTIPAALDTLGAFAPPAPPTLQQAGTPLASMVGALASFFVSTECDLHRRAAACAPRTDDEPLHLPELRAAAVARMVKAAFKLQPAVQDIPDLVERSRAVRAAAFRVSPHAWEGRPQPQFPDLRVVEAYVGAAVVDPAGLSFDRATPDWDRVRDIAAVRCGWAQRDLVQRIDPVRSMELTRDGAAAAEEQARVAAAGAGQRGIAEVLAQAGAKILGKGAAALPPTAEAVLDAAERNLGPRRKYVAAAIRRCSDLRSTGAAFQDRGGKKACVERASGHSADAPIEL